MSPLRRWMLRHGWPGWWAWVAVVLIPLMASMGVLVVSLRVNERSIQRERAARLASERAFCGIIVLLDDQWHQVPPTTVSGRRLASAIAAARTVNHCPPYKGD